MLLLTNRDIHEVLDMGACLDDIERMARTEIPTSWFLEDIRD